MPDLQHGAQRIHFEDSGGPGPALVFCHSYGMNGTMFAPQVEALRATHRCITWDQRGHGGSYTDGPFSFWDSARDLLALLDHLDIARATLIGNSQGGFVALRTALLDAGRVSGLVVIGSSAAAEDPAQKAAFKQLRMALIATRALRLPQFPLNAMSSICFGPGFDSSAWKAKWKQWPTAQFKQALDTLVERDDIVARLPEIAAPTLVLHGSTDRSYPVALGRQIADGVKDGRGFVVVEGGSHFLSVTHPREVSAALGPFLRGLG